MDCHSSRDNVERRDPLVLLRARAALRSVVTPALEGEGLDVTELRDLSDIGGQMSNGRRVVLLLDDVVPGWLGRIAELSDDFPRLGILMLVEPGSADVARAAIIAGVDGFTAHDVPGSALARSVRAVADSEFSIPRSMVADLVEHTRCVKGHLLESSTGTVRLTNREWEIFQLLMQERSTRVMSDALYVSPGTVRTHVGSLLRKLGVRNRAELREMAYVNRTA